MLIGPQTSIFLFLDSHWQYAQKVSMEFLVIFALKDMEKINKFQNEVKSQYYINN